METTGAFVSCKVGVVGVKIICGVLVGVGVRVGVGVAVFRMTVNALIHALPFETTCVRSVHDVPSLLMKLSPARAVACVEYPFSGYSTAIG